MAREGGRTSDDAVNWYCHMRIAALIDSGMLGSAVAEKTGLTPSAVSAAKTKAIGIGPETARKLVALLGFKTRGELVDAADAWWLTDGRKYASQHREADLVAFRRQMVAGVALSAQPADGNQGRGVARARAAVRGKAKKLPKRPDRSRQGSTGE